MYRPAYKYLCLTTALCAALALPTNPVLAQKAQAGAGAMVSPTGGWAVTRIDNSATQGGAYCTLARQFQNGIVFSIGRNKAEEYSLAVDYQQPKLTPDKAYDVKLKAGNQTREVQLMPASPRAMVVRLGWDDSFFDALEKAQSLAVTIDKDSYTLAMTDYAKGKVELAQCMDALKDDAQAPATVAGTDVLAAESGLGGARFSAKKVDETTKVANAKTPPAIDPSKRPEKTIISSLETPEVKGLTASDKAAYVAPQRSTDLASLEEENARLKEMLAHQRREYEGRMSAQGDQTNQIAELQEKLRLAQVKGGGAMAAAATVAPAVAAAPQIKEVIKPDPAQAQKITTLEKQVQELNAQLAARTSAEIKAAPTPLPDPEQAARIAALQTEVNDLKAQQAEVKTASAAAPVQAQKVAQSEKENTEELDTLKKALAARNQEIAELQTKIADPQQSEQPQQGGQHVAALERALSGKEAQINAAQQRLASAERENAKLRQQVGQLQQYAKEEASQTATVTQLKRNNDALREQMAQQQNSYAQKLAVVQDNAVQSIQPAAAKPGQSSIPAMLSRAGIAANQDTARPNGVVDAYQWRTGPITGRAQAIAFSGDAHDISEEYTNAQRNACAGDFASVPGVSTGARVIMDIACVDANGGRAQSLLFTQEGNQVVAFILETPAQNMDEAMDLRDQLNGRI